jgi:hypothetical protein
MWKNMVEPDRPHMTMGITQAMRFARWMTKTTNTLPEFVILTACPLQLFLFKRASLLRDTCIACLVLDPRANSKLLFNFVIALYAS